MDTEFYKVFAIIGFCLCVILYVMHECSIRSCISDSVFISGKDKEYISAYIQECRK